MVLGRIKKKLWYRIVVADVTNFVRSFAAVRHSPMRTMLDRIGLWSFGSIKCAANPLLVGCLEACRYCGTTAPGTGLISGVAS